MPRSKATDLLDRVLAVDGRSWHEKLTKAQRASVAKLRAAWRAGQVSAGPKDTYEKFLEFVDGIRDGKPIVSESQFRRFLGEKPKGAC